MAGRNKHRERSHRSYRSKDAAYRGFKMRVGTSKYNHDIKKSFERSLASFLAMLKFGHKHQDK